MEVEDVFFMVDIVWHHESSSRFNDRGICLYRSVIPYDIIEGR
jgi:hypothetical protein